MKAIIRYSLIIGIVAAIAAMLPFAAAAQPAVPDTPRSIAVTIDDLPTVRGRDIQRMRNITSGLLGHIAADQIPATGFVNEKKLGEPVALPERVALLAQWIEAGLDLGNHSYSHPDFFKTPLADYQTDVLRGDTIITRLLGRRPQYFRHPYLNTGPDRQTKHAFDRFLAENGYAVAPVTIDNDEYIYALAYDRAETTGDDSLADRVSADYLRYMEEMFAFYEQLSRDLLSREPAQILLIHANALNAACLDKLAEMMRRRGYRFVSLAEALKDNVYDRPDEYTGRSGLSWLQRWWITDGNERRREPSAPKWVYQTAYPDRY